MESASKWSASYDSVQRIAGELKIGRNQVQAVRQLMHDGATVPFIARYRKELTGNLDEVQIQRIQEQDAYYTGLDERRATVLNTIEGQGKLTPELQSKILACTDKTEMEDLYLPYKPKRRTRAAMAREKGLEPLAESIMQQWQTIHPEEVAKAYISEEKGVADAAAALAGAMDIVAEQIAEKGDIRAYVRNTFASMGKIVSEAIKDKTQQPTKFEQYYDYSESVATIPSHRYLAIRRGEKDGVLRRRLSVDSEAVLEHMLSMLGIMGESAGALFMQKAAQDAYKRLISPSAEIDVSLELKERSDRYAVEIFANNLHDLLMAAPLGAETVIGIDPGLRTGCKCAVVDGTGRFVENKTIYLTKSEAEKEQAAKDVVALVEKYTPKAIAIGNGTAGRESEQFVRDTLKAAPAAPEAIVVQVSESGASVYSASDIARAEFPDLDLTVRGAISIARRLQDPLAELVKVDPKSIGVGQYQHDVSQPMLQQRLNDVVVSCVNRVGVDLNTASASLLSRVAGLSSRVATSIVAHRERNGLFTNRNELLKVSGLGAKTFEQCAGFLRIRQAAYPLDASAVHPERYTLVEAMAADLGMTVNDLIGRPEAVKKIDSQKYLSDEVGEYTLKDILQELVKPGRDPRSQFEMPAFRDDVRSIDDLQVDMELEGVVTNVTAFGVFVDVGVHQDGLVHISQLSNKFVADPSTIARAGDKIKVRVMDVDKERKRIALSAKTAASAEAATRNEDRRMPTGNPQQETRRRAPQQASRNAKKNRPQRNNKTNDKPRSSGSAGSGFNINPFADL